MASPEVESFRFEAEPRALEDLEQRLRRTIWPDEVSAEPWRYGPPVTYMKRFVEYWVEEYDWPAEQARLNAFPQFVTQIDEHRIHFIHQVGTGPAPIPLVLTHGWPGSVVEMLKIIPLLTNPAAHGGDPADAFTVIAPSIPGYGFSSRPTKRGTNVFVVADLWAKLMTRLNYPQFAVQGGDWGSWVSAATALQHPGQNHRPASQLSFDALSPGDQPERSAAESGRGGLPGACRKMGGHRRRIHRHPGNETIDVELCAHRLAGRPGGVACREVSQLERLPRGARRSAHQG